MSYFVYVLQSNRSRHYIGFTSNLRRRLIKHNSKHKGFTGTTEVWEIILCKELASKTEAMRLERELKAFKNYQRAIEYLKKIGGSAPTESG
jgi:putative endonuclease